MFDLVIGDLFHVKMCCVVDRQAGVPVVVAVERAPRMGELYKRIWKTLATLSNATAIFKYIYQIRKVKSNKKIRPRKYVDVKYQII